jgi:hypothetical protein
VPAETFADYEWTGRAIEYPPGADPCCPRVAEPTVADENALTSGLATEVCPTELSEQGPRDALMAPFRADRIEPPTPGRVNACSPVPRSRATSISPPPAAERRGNRDGRVGARAHAY